MYNEPLSDVPNSRLYHPFNPSAIMPAIRALTPRATHELIKRKNWASENPGVVLVFCIVFIVAVGIISLFAYRKWMSWKAKRQTFEVERPEVQQTQ
ncbi:hypothetical protein BBP40_005142 [Aspergillus hancockii]|nr:hypothetical protein BBP40_005142 [Aspergillus hancockii]